MPSLLRRRVQSVFPTHWLRMLASVVLVSLAVTIVSGVYLALFFDPSMSTVTYRGPIGFLRGVVMTRAYASALDISFGERGGLFVRQLHNWAASLFIASLMACLIAAFFTGVFRRLRAAWAVSVALLLLGVFEAYTGVLVLDDGLSGTSLRMVSGYTLTVPVLGTRLHGMLFGSEFPGTHVIGRIYLVHLLLPAIILGLIALAAALLHRNPPPRSSSPPRSRHRDGRYGVAIPAVAVWAFTAGVLAITAGLFQVNPIWLYGPANSANGAATSTPPWYFGWLDGAVRLWPAWDIHLGRYTIPAPFWPSVVLLASSFALLALYPWIERRVTRDDASHDRPQRPRDAPKRTALGVGVVVFYGCLQLAGATDVIGAAFRPSTDGLFWTLRVAVLLLPPLAAAATYRLCLGLQQRDQAIREHGIETGIIHRLPNGGFVEEHDDHGRSRQLHSSPAASIRGAQPGE
jgi:ubiquinol-cytochrome c reductase cytochrome b subunit